MSSMGGRRTATGGIERRLARATVGSALTLAAALATPEARAQSGQLSPQAQGNRERLVVTPSIRTVYDSNTLRYNDGVSGPRDNVRVTPGVDVIARRIVGRTELNVSGSIGYDFNSRYRFLNRTRIETQGGARLPVGGTCQANLEATYEQFQFDLGEVDRVVGATTRYQSYDLGVSCRRAAGFSPVLGVGYSERSSGDSDIYDSNTRSARAGLSYARPSLGVLTVTASRARIRRPGVRDLVGFADGTDVTQVSLALSRNVSPRLGFEIGAGLVRADPQRASVGGFTGPSFNAQVTWRPHPRFVVDGSAQRQITTQNGINATYVLRDDYRLGVSYRVSQASRFRVSAAHIDRDFRGRAALPFASLIGHDATDIVTAAYSYDTRRILRFTFSASQRWRDADVSRYDYKSTQLAVSVGAKF